jgi:hypothetical protein
LHVTADSGFRGAGIGDQREPFHASGREPIFMHQGKMQPSTMTHNRREVHDKTPAVRPQRSFRIDHLEPFQVPSKEDTLPVNVGPYTSIPSATHDRGEPHDTLVNSL